MEVPMTSDIRVFLGTLAVSVISWVFLVAVMVPICLPRRLDPVDAGFPTGFSTEHTASYHITIFACGRVDHASAWLCCFRGDDGR